MHNNNYKEKSFFHFSFLRDIKVNGIYFNSFTRYLNLYPFIRKEHYHDFYTIILFTGGNGTIKVTNDSCAVQSQSICLIAPNQMHSFEFPGDAEGIVFFFCQDFYVEEFSYIRLLDIFSCASKMAGNICNSCLDLSASEFIQVSNLIRSIEVEYESTVTSSSSASIIRSLLNIMLLRLSDFYDMRSVRSFRSDSILIHELSSLVDSSFIREHQTGFYTTTLNVSEKHLNDLCFKYFNCSLKKILTDRLMQEARKQLLSSDITISELSYKLNFEDNSYFNKVFKKNTHLTPKRFRDIHRKLIP